MDLNNLLSNLGIGSRETVYMSVTPSIGLELIQLDIQTKTVKNYAFRPIEYNESLREIGNYDIFKEAVLELFEELKINPKCNVILNLPMTIFGSKELPLLLADDAVTEALTSEVEQSYIFKRFEPIVSWTDSLISHSTEMRKLFYTAVQKNQIDNIKATLSGIGASLISVEMSLTSILKALSFAGLAEEQMKDNITWNLMIINPNGYGICSMIGKNIVDYCEEPLAIKSFEDEEVYNSINASAQITLMSYPANYLYIVSETDLVSAELLSKRINVEGIVQYLENNSFKKQELIPADLNILSDNALKISLESIGIATGNTTGLPTKFNFLQSSSGDTSGDDLNELIKIKIGDKEFEISPLSARNFSAIIATVLLVPTLIVFLVAPMIAKTKQAKLDDINSRCQQVQEQVTILQDEQSNANNFDVNSEIKKVLGYNRTKLMAYSALGEAVPKKLWLTYFVAKDDGKINIKGQSSNVEDVYTFFKNLKDSLINTKLRLHKLEMLTGTIDDVVTLDPTKPAIYEFEITNMTDSELNPEPISDDDQSQQNNGGMGGNLKNE